MDYYRKLFQQIQNDAKVLPREPKKFKIEHEDSPC